MDKKSFIPHNLKQEEYGIRVFKFNDSNLVLYTTSIPHPVHMLLFVQEDHREMHTVNNEYFVGFADTRQKIDEEISTISVYSD